MDYYYIDIETVPLDKADYLSKKEDERKKLMNPIDSKIIAVGLKKKGDKQTKIFDNASEKELLENIWAYLSEFRKGSAGNKIVGFNIKEFDLPFIITRSFLNSAKITPFTMNDVIDLREYLSAFKFGNTRGKMKEFASFIGIDILEDMDGEKVAEEYWKGNNAKIKEYLEKDIEITESIHDRLVELRISELQRW